MIGGMIMEDLDDQGVLAGINIIIPRELDQKNICMFKVGKHPKYISCQTSEKETWVR
jgi:hypothetical protein